MREMSDPDLQRGYRPTFELLLSPMPEMSGSHGTNGATIAERIDSVRGPNSASGHGGIEGGEPYKVWQIGPGNRWM
jgi:hypothetical protein